MCSATCFPEDGLTPVETEVGLDQSFFLLWLGDCLALSHVGTEQAVGLSGPMSGQAPGNCVSQRLGCGSDSNLRWGDVAQQFLLGCLDQGLASWRQQLRNFLTACRLGHSDVVQVCLQGDRRKPPLPPVHGVQGSRPSQGSWRRHLLPLHHE